MPSGALDREDLSLRMIFPSKVKQGRVPYTQKYEVFNIDLEFPTHQKFVFFPLTLLAGFPTQTNTHFFIDKSEGVY